MIDGIQFAHTLALALGAFLGSGLMTLWLNRAKHKSKGGLSREVTASSAWRHDQGGIYRGGHPSGRG